MRSWIDWLLSGMYGNLTGRLKILEMNQARMNIVTMEVYEDLYGHIGEDFHFEPCQMADSCYTWDGEKYNLNEDVVNLHGIEGEGEHVH